MSSMNRSFFAAAISIWFNGSSTKGRVGDIVYFESSPGNFRQSTVEELDDTSKGGFNVVLFTT